MVQVATARGVELRERTRVSAIRPAGAGVEVVTKRGTWDANVAVVTAGAWGRPVFVGGGVDLPVTPSPETVAFFPGGAGAALPGFVGWIDGGGPRYARPTPR